MVDAGNRDLETVPPTYELVDHRVPGGRRFALMHAGEAVSFAEVIAAWQRDTQFCAWFSDRLAAAPYDVFRWETPPVTRATSTRAFEFVLLDAPEIDLPPDRSPFEAQFDTALMTVFENLGGDALMVVPNPRASEDAYPHLAAFLRRAPRAQVDALWPAIGGALDTRLDVDPVWLNTAGGGVAWLHVRLDSQPKYYRHAPYRRV